MIAVWITLRSLLARVTCRLNFAIWFHDKYFPDNSKIKTHFFVLSSSPIMKSVHQGHNPVKKHGLASPPEAGSLLMGLPNPTLLAERGCLASPTPSSESGL